MPGEEVNGLWIGELGPIQKLSMSSFLKQGHKYILWTYNKLKGVPKGVIVKDANEILDKKYIFRHWSGNLATFADIFRYKLLHERGGWWVDLDLVSLKPLPRDIKYFYGGERTKKTGAFKRKYGHVFWIGLMKFPKGDPVLKYIYEDMLANRKNFQNKNSKLEFNYGQTILREVLEELHGDDFIYKLNKYNVDLFNPLSYFDMIDFFKDGDVDKFGNRWGWETMSLKKTLKSAYTVHLYNKIIKEIEQKKGTKSRLIDILEKRVFN